MGRLDCKRRIVFKESEYFPYTERTPPASTCNRSEILYGIQLPWLYVHKTFAGQYSLMRKKLPMLHNNAAVIIAVNVMIQPAFFCYASTVYPFMTLVEDLQRASVLNVRLVDFKP